jgi:hypothetical protein
MLWARDVLVRVSVVFTNAAIKKSARTNSTSIHCTCNCFGVPFHRKSPMGPPSCHMWHRHHDLLVRRVVKQPCDPLWMHLQRVALVQGACDHAFRARLLHATGLLRRRRLALASLRTAFLSRKEDNAIFNCPNIQSMRMIFTPTYSTKGCP